MKKKLIVIMVLFAMVLNIRLGYLQATNYIVNNDDDGYIELNSYEGKILAIEKDILIIVDTSTS